LKTGYLVTDINKGLIGQKAANVFFEYVAPSLIGLDFDDGIQKFHRVISQNPIDYEIHQELKYQISR